MARVLAAFEHARHARATLATAFCMSGFEQYELWVFNGNRWEITAWFDDFDVASAVIRGRTQRVRLIHAVFEEGKRVREEILAEVGSTREKP